MFTPNEISSQHVAPMGHYSLTSGKARSRRPVEKPTYFAELIK